MQFTNWNASNKCISRIELREIINRVLSHSLYTDSTNI